MEQKSSTPLSSEKLITTSNKTKEDLISDNNCVRHWNRFVRDCTASSEKLLLGILEQYQNENVISV
jgi:hypothetical protein